MNSRFIKNYWYSGVYVIRNTTNGKCYVGSSSNIERRISKHKGDLESGKHCNHQMQADYNRGHRFFVDVAHVETISPYERGNRLKLYQKEKAIIKQFDSIEKGYNVNGIFTVSFKMNDTHEEI